MMDHGQVIAAGILAGLLFLAAPAEAQITFRAASPSGISLVGDARMPATDDANTSATNASVTPPGSMLTNDYVVVYVAARTTGVTIGNPTTGGQTWTAEADSEANNISFRIFHTRFNGTWSANPNFSWTNSVPYQVWMLVFRGVDTTTAIDAAPNIAAFAADTTSPFDYPISASTITTATAHAMVIASWHSNDNNQWGLQTAGWSNPNGQPHWRNSGGSDSSSTIGYKTQATAGGNEAVANRQTTVGGDAGIQSILALRPSPTSLTITRPAGTALNDVMIASVAVRPYNTSITAPSGWTLVRRMESTAANTHFLEVYQKVAGASEPSSYTWTLGAGAVGAVAGIQSFSGVDTLSPINADDGLQDTPNALTHSTPDITTTVTNTMLVTAHSFSSSATWTPPGGMTEAYDRASLTVPNSGGQAIEGSYQPQVASGATGVKTATASGDTDYGNTHILALRPSCASVADASYVAAAAPSGTGSVTAYWSSANPVIVLRKATAAFLPDEVPVHGTTYTAGTQPWGAGAAMPYVVYDGTTAMSGVTCTATSCTNTGLTNGTIYYYKVFPKSGTCYASGIGAEVDAAPQAGTHPAWSYSLAGGSMLKAGIAGNGAIYTGSNASRIVSLSTTDGTQSWAPVATTDAVQGWLTWIPISGGSNAAVIGGDWAGKVYSVNTATGATNWAVTLPGGTNEPVQAPAAAQLRVYSDATFQATHATDIVLVATRTSSTTNNKLYALRASDGGIAWTFNGTGANSVDYVVGQPYVDYGRNRVYLATRAGSGAQSSLWVIDTLNGSLVASFALGHLQTSPTLSYSGATLWVGNTAGDLYAINMATLAQKWTTPAALGSAVKGFVWEDLTTAGRLYFTTADGNVWCLQDPGAGPPPNPASPVWKTMVAGASMPLLLDSLYVGSTDGKVHELNVITGVDTKQFTLAGTGGDVSTEDSTQIFVPTSAGKIYKIPLPLP